MQSPALLTFSNLDLQEIQNGNEMKWCLFTKLSRGSIGKIVIDTVGNNIIANSIASEVQREGSTAMIVSLFVQQKWRGKKLGEELVKHAQLNLYENGFHYLTLEAEEDAALHNKLVKFYENLGFSVIDDYKVSFEYNGDQCFRKIGMICNLKQLFNNNNNKSSNRRREDDEEKANQPQDEQQQQLTPQQLQLLFSFDFALSLKREAIEHIALLQQRKQSCGVFEALEKIEKNHPGTFIRALRTGMYIHQHNHPDWMQLAGFLRYLGYAQEFYSEWHSPYNVALPNLVSNQTMPKNDDDENVHADDEANDDHLTMSDKSGPMPSWLTRESFPVDVVETDENGFLAPGMSLDEVTLTWTSDEYAYLLLRNFHPPELARVLRYKRFLNQWKEKYDSYMSEEDSYLKEFVTIFVRLLETADEAAEVKFQNEQQLNHAKFVLEKLIYKYLANACA